MQEGWYQEQHFILFDEDEAEAATQRYAIAETLPGFRIVGLRGWDDFILRHTARRLFTVPTLPAIARYLAPLSDLPPYLESDHFRRGFIKWYVQPLVFGGSPEVEDNVIWLDQQQHAAIVVWWNRKYRAIVSAPR